MELKNEVKQGDWLLITSNGILQSLVRWFTIGKVNHAAIVYDDVNLLEEDWKARLNPLSKYNKTQLYIVRYLNFAPGLNMKPYLDKYLGRPYSLWDICLEAALSPFNKAIREKAIDTVGNRYFMICSELVARITYEMTGYKALSEFTGLTPQDLLDIAKSNPSDFLIIPFNLS